MVWKVEISDHAEAQIRRMDKSLQKHVYNFLNKLEREEDPFKLLIPYSGDMAGLWKKRLGDWRIVIESHRNKLTLLVMKTDHRSKIYR